jgi:hypothetical protein
MIIPACFCRKYPFGRGLWTRLNSANKPCFASLRQSIIRRTFDNANCISAAADGRDLLKSGGPYRDNLTAVSGKYAVSAGILPLQGFFSGGTEDEPGS